MMQRTPTTRERGAPISAFTLIELMTVIAIMAVLTGILFPAISVLSKGSHVDAGMNTLSAAVTTARAYARRSVPFTRDLLPDQTTNPGVQSSVDGYSGVAMLFCPSNEIRIVENDELAVTHDGDDEDDQPDRLELEPVNISSNAPAHYVYRNGFRDIEGVDYIRMPDGVGVAGLTRGGSGTGEILVLAPPFAVRLDEYGHIVNGRASSSPDRIVYYNGDYDYEEVQFPDREDEYWPLITTSGEGSDRGHPRIVPGFSNAETNDPDVYDATCREYNPLVAWAKTDTGRDKPNRVDKYILPFETIDTVIGVVIYDKRRFWGECSGWDSYSISTSDAEYLTRRDWLLDPANGNKVVFFNRYTGAMIRE